MKKILITGGSGFIGTNLISKFRNDYEILNIDIKEPKIKSHYTMWKNIDICDLNKFETAVAGFDPEIIVHLAARTDLNGKELKDYNANIDGVSNLLSIACKLKNIERVVFASSMYVCIPGYHPKDFDDYCPHTVYGESKVLTEQLIKQNQPDNYCWSIIRPTSIWGPWFGEPYLDFFKVVMNKRYIHMGERACVKTYGYIANTIYQIESLLNSPAELVSKKIYYLGDYEPYDISEWANEIANNCQIKIPKVPYFVFQALGLIGDILKTMRVKFPMTSFRLRNMTTNNIQNLEPIKAVAPDLPVKRIDGVIESINWIKTQKK